MISLRHVLNEILVKYKNKKYDWVKANSCLYIVCAVLCCIYTSVRSLSRFVAPLFLFFLKVDFYFIFTCLQLLQLVNPGI